MSDDIDFEAGIVPSGVVSIAPELSIYMEKVIALEEEATAIEICDQKGSEVAVTALARVRKLEKAIDAKRKDLTKDARDFISSVNNIAKGLTDHLSAADNVLKKKVSAWQYQEEMERLRQERALKAAQEALKRRVEEEAMVMGVEPPEVLETPVKAHGSVIRTEAGTAHLRKVWKGEVVNAAEVPVEFLSPDQKKIDEAIKSGVRDIPGVRVYEQLVTAVRR